MSTESPPLELVDTPALLECMRQHRGEAADVEAEIIRRHLDLVQQLAKAYACRGIDRHAFEQLAREALLRAVHAFDQDGADFVPFATTAIILQVRQRLRESPPSSYAALQP